MESTPTGVVGQHTAREEAMRSLIAEREHTGVTVKAFCARHQLSESCYYYWRKEHKAPNESGTFGILNLHDVQAETAGSLFCEVISPGDSTIRFYQPVPGSFLQSIL